MECLCVCTRGKGSLLKGNEVERKKGKAQREEVEEEKVLYVWALEKRNDRSTVRNR